MNCTEGVVVKNNYRRLPLLTISVTAGVIYFENYLSFLIFGIICTTLAAKRIVSEAAEASMPKEKQLEVKEAIQNKEIFMSATVIAGLIIGTALYLLKQFALLF